MTLSEVIKTGESSEKDYYLIGLFRKVELPHRRPGSFNKPSAEEIAELRKHELAAAVDETDSWILDRTTNSA